MSVLIEALSGTASVARRLSPRLVVIALTALALLLTFTASASWARGAATLPVMLLGGIAALLLVHRPRLVAFLVLLTGASILKPPFAPLDIAGVRTDAHEILSYLLIGMWISSAASNNRHRVTPYTAPLLGLLAAVVVGIGVGAASGADSYLIKGQGKTWLVYLVALPFIALFANPRGREQLERWVVWLCTLWSVLAILGLLVGMPVANDTPNITLNTLGVDVDVNRTRPAFLSLLLVAILLLLARCLSERFTPVRVLQLALFTVMEALSYNRATWATLVLCVLGLILLRPGPRVHLRGLRTAIALLVVATASLGASAQGLLGADAQAVSVRLQSVVSPEITRDPSYEDRRNENLDALRTLRERPVTGVGVGGLYGARRPYYRPDLMRVVYQDRPFVHNSLIYLYLQLGLLGVLVMTWLGVRVAREVTTWRTRERDPVVAARGVAAGLAVAGLATQALANTYLLHRPSITALAVALALVARRPSAVEAVDAALPEARRP